MTPVPVTLITAAALVFVNLWLAARVSSLRRTYKISVGDGGNDALMRRMRAQANFVEHVPLFLMLLGGLELSRGNPLALAMAAATFVIARVAHAVGMEGGPLTRWRMYGMMGTTLATLALALWAFIYAAENSLRG
jgi:uncharacterized membrane protein YecN with MAPEG domain